MSGMTLGTIVVETPEGSGALISANHAPEQDREVYAVPGNLFSPISRGANQPIKRSGVKLVWDYKTFLRSSTCRQWVARSRWRPYSRRTKANRAS